MEKWSIYSKLSTTNIHRTFIEHLEKGLSRLIFDDDDTGEAADIITISEHEQTIKVSFYHCKFSSGNQPGTRVKDLYEVCGQAQKSSKWTWDLRHLVRHIRTRESKHRRGRDTRFCRGSLADLLTISKEAKRKFVQFEVCIVQPGLSKSALTPEYLSMLGATDSYIRCITNRPLRVFAST